jgi:type IV pilus assembly protein PilE
MKIREHGFTLIELMTVVVVISLLVMIAYPSYQEHVRKGNRAEGKAALLRAAQAQERFFSDRGAYAAQDDLGAAFGLAAGAPLYSGENPGTPGKYRITVVLTGTTVYTLTATPTSATDLVAGGCGNLTLNSTGTRGRSGDKPMNQCW